MNRPPDEAIPHVLTLEGIEKLALQPEEAFVLTRVNGVSTFREIGQILGYDTARVWQLLTRAAEAGLIGVGEKKQPAPAVKRPKGPTILEQLDEEDRDPELSKIPRSKRSEIRLRHAGMVSQTHYEVLGVLPGASADLIKRKYLELVKDFHPDRFFGQELGPYMGKLEALFERVTLAHDELIDPARRKEYDRALGGKTSMEESKEAGKKPSEWIKKPPSDHIERLAAAKRYFEMGKKEEQAGNILKAANFYQLAVQYDPKTGEYVKAWEKTKHHIHRRKADDLVEQAADSLLRGKPDEALSLLEEAHRRDPRKKECYRELTMLYLKKGRIAEAQKMAVGAVEFFPQDPRVHAAMGLIYKELGDKKSAIRELRISLRLDETQTSVKNVLNELERIKKSGPGHRN